MLKKVLKKRSIIPIVIILLIIGGIKFASRGKNGSKVTTTKVDRGTVAEELILTGEIDADQHVDLTFATAGKIAWVGVKEGDKVIKGQALAALDKTTLDTAYQQARSMLRKYEATVDKIHDDLKNKATTETYTERNTRTTAEADKDYYYDAFRTAEYNLTNATLTAPFNGIVTYAAYPAGVNVLSTQTEIELVNPDTIYFNATADQSEIIKLSQGQQVNVVFDSYPEKTFTGKVAFLGLTPKPGETGANYKIKVVIDQNQETTVLRIGMTGDAKFILSQKENVLYLPPKFVNSDTKGKYVKLDKKKNKTYIKTGLEGEERIEITEGLKQGDMVFD